MSRVTVTLPDSDEPAADQLARLLEGIPVLPSGTAEGRTVELSGERRLLIVALYAICHPDYERAHALVPTIEDGR